MPMPTLAGAAAAKSQAPSFQKLDSIQRTMEQCFDELNLLQERIGHILVPEAPSSDAKTASEAPCQSALLERLDLFVSTSDRLFRRIVELRERIDV
jgi:hypothetical protein